MAFGNYSFDSGVGILELKTPGLMGTWLAKAQTEDLQHRSGVSLTKEASVQWAKAGREHVGLPGVI